MWTRPFGILRPVDEIAMLTRRYMYEYGGTRDHLANVAIAFRKHAARNPASTMGHKQLTRDDYMNARWISEPLCLFDNCLETDGALAVVSSSRYNGRGYDVRLELHGSADSIAAGLGPRLPLRSTEPDAAFPDGEPYTFFMDRFADAFRAELAAFTEVVAGRRTSPCPVADAVEASWIAEACTLSLREHRPIRLDEVRP